MVVDSVQWGSTFPLSLTELFSSEIDSVSQWLKSDDFVQSLGDCLGLSWEVQALQIAASPERFLLSFTDAKSTSPVCICFHLSGLTDDVLAYLLTQATGCKSADLILVSSRLSREQEVQVRWLNDITPQGFDVYSLEFAAWKVGQTNIVLPTVTASVDQRGVHHKLSFLNPGERHSLKPELEPAPLVENVMPFIEFWLAFNANLLKRKSTIVGQKPMDQNWTSYLIDEHFKFVVSLDPVAGSCAVGLVIGGPKYVQHYEQLYAMKDVIENELEMTLFWELKQERGFARIHVRHFGFDMADSEQWGVLHLWLATMLEKFQATLELKVNVLLLQDRFNSARDEGLQQKINWDAVSSR